MRFDATVLAEHKAEEARLTKELGILAEKMLNEHESDEWSGDDGPAKQSRYMADQARHGQLMRERDYVNGRIERIEDIRPKQIKPGSEPHVKAAFRKFLQGEKLDSEEQDLYLNELDPGVAKALPNASGGEVFRVQAAATDPTRSDIDTGDSAAGLAAPEEWEAGLVERLKYFGAVASSCWNFDTSNGNDRHMNQMDSTSEEGGSLGDQATGIGSANPLANVTDIVFKSYVRHSQMMGARLEAIDDVQFDLPGRILREAYRRLGAWLE